MNLVINNNKFEVDCLNLYIKPDNDLKLKSLMFVYFPVAPDEAPEFINNFKSVVSDVLIDNIIIERDTDTMNFGHGSLLDISSSVTDHELSISATFNLDGQERDINGM